MNYSQRLVRLMNLFEESINEETMLFIEEFVSFHECNIIFDKFTDKELLDDFKDFVGTQNEI